MLEDQNKEEQTQYKVVQAEPSALTAVTRGEIDIQISTAKRYPRSIKKFKKDALSMATSDLETAASFFYKLKRGGKIIEGPGIRGAEICNHCWGNLRTGARIIEIGDEFVTAQGICHDLETNCVATIEIKRRITDKNGNRFSEDMIGVTCNAACSIAYRNATFKNIPKSFVNQIFEAAKRVAVGSQKTINERRNHMLDSFMKMGVDEKQIIKYLEKEDVEDINLKDIETLIGVYNAIKDGDSTIDEQFPESKSTVSKPQSLSESKKKGEATPKQIYVDLIDIVSKSNKKVQQAYAKLMEEYLTKNNKTDIELSDADYEKLNKEIREILN